MSLLTISDLDAYYAKAQVLHGVSVEVERGGIVGIIGPNGAGKSTLLDAISGLKSYEGRIEFEGEALAGKSPREIVRRGLIHCTETRDLFPYFTVRENLLMGAYSKSDDVHDRLDLVYDLFPRLDERREQEAVTMSGGEQQMLAIGRALMGDPELLMLDEPTLGLAPVIIEQIGDTLAELSDQGLTILLAEQNASFALRHAEYLYLLETGEIQRSGTAAELKDDKYVRDAYMGVV